MTEPYEADVALDRPRPQPSLHPPPRAGRESGERATRLDRVATTDDDAPEPTESFAVQPNGAHDAAPRGKWIKARLRHWVQSGSMWCQALLYGRSRRRSIVIAPSHTRWDAASNLRAWKLAPALRQLGWRVLLLAPEASLAERRRVLRLWRPDVMLLQQSRHPLNRPSLYPGVRCVFDQDDADYLDHQVRGDIVECCQGSELVIAGSRAVARMLGRHNANVEVIWTSTPAPPPQHRHSPPSKRESIVAWAHASPFDYPAEMDYVRAAMHAVARVRPGTQFWLFGCGDDARARAWFQPLEAAGIRCRAWSYMPYRRYLDVVARAAVGLQPVCVEDSPYSEGKSFGKVLAYLAGDVPVVASDNVDHPLFFDSGRNGFLVRDPIDCAQAVVTLLDDKALRDDVAAAAMQDFRMRLSTAAVAAQVSSALLKVMGVEPMDSSQAGDELLTPSDAATDDAWSASRGSDSDICRVVFGDLAGGREAAGRQPSDSMRASSATR